MELFAPRIYTARGFVREHILGGAKALDVGCGSRKLPGAIGVDIVKTPQVDVLHDLALFPWPFETNTFDLIFLNHALEHMEELLKTMSEIHRIARPGARIVIQVPYFRSADAYTDPTHRHFFTSRSLDYFVEGTGCDEYRYVPIRFKKLGFWYGWPQRSRNSLRRALKGVMHRYPQWYDQYLSLLLPVDCLTWELEVIKDKDSN
ncbi:MAG TPA: class I SAM-dependent methyltransferase [Candidatus Paceibacterota bacterium]